ncbi:MAG: hypothetical protein Q7R39_03850 [Dehalococcoidia bacterium]|nr:hypothetical protein [Dehalococcoidia bacterium]
MAYNQGLSPYSVASQGVMTRSRVGADRRVICSNYSKEASQVHWRLVIPV